MNRPLTLLRSLLLESAEDLGINATRCVRTLERRVACEGLSFLTITLPKLCDWLEYGLENGIYPKESSQYFRDAHGMRFPAFLQGFTCRIFEDTGMLKPDACPRSVDALRQLTRFFKKMKESCSPERELAAQNKFKALELEMQLNDELVTRADPILDAVCSRLGRVFADFDPASLVCRHGPGATAERLSTNGRLTVKQWPERSLSFFPLEDHAIPNYSHWEDLGAVKILEEDEEPPVRVVFVPKTSVTPRVIAIEPSHMQYMQQALRAYLYDTMERRKPFSGHVNFARQDINRTLARKASIDRRKATLDLSDASDRVHNLLAHRVCKYAPFWQYAQACRSKTATTPDGTTLKLAKFASMGSALCFPIEAYVFYALCISAIHVHRRVMPTASTIAEVSKDVYIYGDDIIVDAGVANVVTQYLESFGLRVNTRKSFSKGNFRESCGGDYYKGYPVEPVYARRLIPTQRSEWTIDVAVSWSATRNLLYLKGYWKTCRLIEDWLHESCFCVRYLSIGNLLEKDDVSDVQRYNLPGGVTLITTNFNSGVKVHRGLQCPGQYYTDLTNPLEKDQVESMSGALLKGLSNIGALNSVSFTHSIISRDVLKPTRRWRAVPYGTA